MKFVIGRHYRITSMGRTDAVGKAVQVVRDGVQIRLLAWTADAQDRDVFCLGYEVRPATRAEINEANATARERRKGW